MTTCPGRINLATPFKSEQVLSSRIQEWVRVPRKRGGFQPPWHTVYLYKCPQCSQEIRVRSSSFIGKRAQPGVGAIVCGREVAS